MGKKGWSLVSATPPLLLPSEISNKSVVKCHLEGVNESIRICLKRVKKILPQCFI